MLDSAQFKRGKDVEAWLDRFFRGRGWSITETTPHEERVLCLGDRWFNKGDRTLSIEYKSGIQTRATGNIFLETVSVDTDGKPGWVYTCAADYIFYACLLNGVILIFVPSFLRAKIGGLKAQFPTKKTHKQNVTYKTHGVIVPLDYAVQWLAKRVIDIHKG